MPDFRAAERTFQLLTQVAGRAGRGDKPGEVIIQTFSPDHYSVQCAVSQDYLAFYQQELEYRRELKYPPFSRLANIICSDSIASQASLRADRLAAVLKQLAPKSVEVIGPSEAPLARLKNNWRFHVALRAPVDYNISGLVESVLTSLMSADRMSIQVDIDPLSML